MMSTQSIWSSLIPVLLLMLVNKSVAQKQKPRALFWDIPVKKADPPPPTGSIWDIPVPKPAPILPPQSNSWWENPDFPAKISSESSPPCSCTFEHNSGDGDSCVIYGLSIGSLVAWKRATTVCIEEIGLPTRAAAHAEANLLCPANVDDENMDVLKFVELIQEYPSNPMAVRVKQLFLDTGIFVETENGVIDMADKVSMQQGPVLDCTLAPMFCWKEIEATFERKKHILIDFCGQLQEEKVADLQLEQQNVRIELCSRGEDSESLPMACRALWKQIQDEKANFPNAGCSAFGEGPGDAELPTCSNSIAVIDSDIDNNTTRNEASASLWKLNNTYPIDESDHLSPFVPDFDTTVEEFVDGELCPCTLHGGDDEEQCRVYGLSANGEDNVLKAWHKAPYSCLKSLDTIFRSVNPSWLRSLCPDGSKAADPFHFVEFIRKHQRNNLAYRIGRLFLDQGLFVEKDNGEIVLPDTISLFSGHILDCNATPMSCWNEIEYKFRQSSNVLQDFCLGMLEEEMIKLQKEQQEARVLLCGMDTPAPQECMRLWEQVEEEKTAFPDVDCMAFGQGLGDAEFPTCSSSSKNASGFLVNDEGHSAPSQDPSTAERTKSNSHSSLPAVTYTTSAPKPSETFAPSPSTPSMSTTPYGECACSFEQDDEASCRVYGSSVSGAKNELKNWHKASDACLEELVRTEINRLCSNGTANVTEFAHLVLMETLNVLSERTKQKFLDTSLFVETDNGTVAVTGTITDKSGVTQNCTVTPMFCWHEIKLEFEEEMTRLEELCSEMRVSPPTIDLKTGQEWARVVLCESNNNTVPEQCRPLGDQIKEEQELYPAALCSTFGEGPGDARLPVCNVSDRTAEILPPTSDTSVPENFTAVRFTGISIVLVGVGSLNTSATEQWVTTTVNFYESVHNGESAEDGRKLSTAGIRDFSTSINVQDESVTGSSATIVYNTQVKYVRTSPDGPTSWELIQDPLKDRTLNQRYTEALRTSHSAFANLESVGVPSIPPPSAASHGNSNEGNDGTSHGNSNEGNDGSDDKGGIKAGAIIGFFVLALCALTVCYAAYRHLRSGKFRSAALTQGEGECRILEDERSTSSRDAVSSQAIEDDRYSSTSEILDSILRDRDKASFDCAPMPMPMPRVVVPCMSEDTEGVDLECQMYAMRTIRPSKTPDNVPADKQSSLPSVICAGMEKQSSPRKKSRSKRFKTHDGVFKIDCCDYEHVFGDDQNDDEYLALSLQNSIVGDSTKSSPSTMDGIDHPVEEACGDDYEGDVENSLPDSLLATNSGGASRSSSSSTRSNASSEDDRDRQQSRLPVSPRNSFVNIHTPETDSRTGGERGSPSHYPSDTSSGMYFDDDNVVVVVEDTVMQQRVIFQHEASYLGSREEDTTSSDSNSIDNESDNSNNWPVDEEVIDVEAPPGWLGVVIDTSDPTGPPTVYEIKNSSPMRDLLKVGDKIIAVDDEDVTHTSAPDVSLLINKRATNPIRKLRILREYFAEEFETQRAQNKNQHG